MFDVAMAESQSVRTVQQWRCDVCKEKTFDSFKEACEHEEQCMQLTVKASASLPQEPSEQSLSSATSVIDLEGASVPEPPLKRTNEVFEVLSSPEESMSKKKQRTQMNASRASAVQPKFLNVDVSAATKPSKPTKKASNNKSSSKGSSAAAQNIPLFFQGLSQAELMAEQAAVEFRAKRLLQQKKQRERAEKRQKQQKDQAQSKASNAAPSVFKKIVERTRAPRFPNPSHVIPAETITSTESPAKSSDLQPWWRRDASAGTTTTDIDTAEPPLLPPAESAYAKQPPLVDYLKLALDSIVIAPKTKPKATRLWADVYFNERLLQGFVPEHLKDVSEQMIAFVQSWMAERRNAHDRAAEKQRKLTQQQQNQHRLKKKSSSHASKKCVDDDWFESDAEEDDDGLKNLCHLTGPSGLGKSALVHAVARICGCRVIELNTSDKRGAAAIRKTLEEATQSHSSMELLRDRQGQELSAATLQDSDDEGAGEKHSAVSLILIDEVDNIDASDCGFWMALNDLTKRAKCPIFLTSNEQPEESRVLAWRSLILPVFRPQPVDCVPFMREVLEEEGFILRSNDTRTVQKALSIVAELCNLDMRRIINEFQLFASNQMTKEPVPVVDSDKSLANDCGPSSSTVVLPQVYQVRPAAVRFDQYDLLTIKGSGFMDLASPPVLEGGGYCVHAYVGNHICPAARIMDDETVLAVSPIVHLPIGYSRFGRFHGDEYQSISICGVPMLGHNSTTLGSVAVMELPNGESVLQNNVPVHLQYHFSDVQRGSTEGDSESEAEAEFDESPKATRLSTTRTSSIKHSSCNDETATAGILREGIKAWKGHTVDKQQVLIDGSKLDNLRLSAVATELRSDAAMLEELSSSGLPYLSGACRGFGFDLTDAYPASTNANTKPPTNDRLYSSAWNDDCYFFGNSDCYMTSKISTREKHLLKLTESSIRGQSHQNLAKASAATSSGDGAEENNHEDDEQLTGPSSEDSLLYSPSSTSLLALPFYLRCNSSSTENHSLEKMARRVLFEQRRRNKIEQDVDLLGEYILPWIHPATIFRFHRGISRELDPLHCSKELLDSTIYQETLPILRVMSVREKVNKMVTESLKNDAEPAFTSTRKTRNSRGDQHCLERISPMFNANEDGLLSSWEVGERLANSSLLYVISNLT